jgi:hypothetical protein
MSIYDKVELRIIDLPSKIQLTARQEREIKKSYLDATDGKGIRLTIIVTPFMKAYGKSSTNRKPIFEYEHTIYIDKYDVKSKFSFLELVAHELAHLKHPYHDEDWLNLYTQFLERFIMTLRRGE